MDIFLNGLKNFLEFIELNWTSIIVVIGLLISVVRKVKVYFSKSTDEKIEIAKKQIQETMLKLISDAELDYEEWVKAGSIKRSQVIEQIFEKYPILSKVVNQESLIEWIDKTIDESLKTMREIFDKNTETK